MLQPRQPAAAVESDEDTNDEVYALIPGAPRASLTPVSASTKSQESAPPHMARHEDMDSVVSSHIDDDADDAVAPAFQRRLSVEGQSPKPVAAPPAQHRPAYARRASTPANPPATAVNESPQPVPYWRATSTGSVKGGHSGAATKSKPKGKASGRGHGDGGKSSSSSSARSRRSRSVGTVHRVSADSGGPAGTSHAPSTPGASSRKHRRPSAGSTVSTRSKSRSRTRRGRRMSTGGANLKASWGAGHTLPIYLRKYEQSSATSAAAATGTAVPSLPGTRRHSTPVRQHVGRPAGGYPFPSAPALVPAPRMPKLSSTVGAKLTKQADRHHHHQPQHAGASAPKRGTTRRRRHSAAANKHAAPAPVDTPVDGDDVAPPSAMAPSPATAQASVPEPAAAAPPPAAGHGVPTPAPPAPPSPQPVDTHGAANDDRGARSDLDSEPSPARALHSVPHLVATTGPPVPSLLQQEAKAVAADVAADQGDDDDDDGENAGPSGASSSSTAASQSPRVADSDSASALGDSARASSQCFGETCTACGAPPVDMIAHTMRRAMAEDDASVFSSSSAGATGWQDVAETVEDLAGRMAAAKGVAMTKLQLAHVTAENTNLQGHVQELMSAAATANHHIETLTRRLEDAEAARDDAAAASKAAQAEVEALNTAVAHNREELARQHQAAMDLDRVRMQLQRKLENEEAQRDAVQQELQRAQDALATATAETAAARSTADAATAELEAARHTAQEAQAASTTATEDAARATAECDCLRLDNTKLERALEQSGEVIKDQMETIEALRARVKSAAAAVKAQQQPLLVNTAVARVAGTAAAGTPASAAGTATPVSTASSTARRQRAEEERAALLALIEHSKSKSSRTEGELQHLCAQLEELEEEMLAHSRHVKSGSTSSTSGSRRGSTTDGGVSPRYALQALQLAKEAKREATVARSNLAKYEAEAATTIQTLQRQVETLQSELHAGAKPEERPPASATVAQLTQELQQSWEDNDDAKARLADYEEEMERLSRDLQRMFTYAASLQAQLETQARHNSSRGRRRRDHDDDGGDARAGDGSRDLDTTYDTAKHNADGSDGDDDHADGDSDDDDAADEYGGGVDADIEEAVLRGALTGQWAPSSGPIPPSAVQRTLAAADGGDSAGHRAAAASDDDDDSSSRRSKYSAAASLVDMSLLKTELAKAAAMQHPPRMPVHDSPYGSGRIIEHK